MTTDAEFQEPNGRAQGLRRMSPARALLIRRGIGLGIMLTFAYTVFHVIFLTNLLDPLLVYVEPVKGAITWVTEDPTRAWMALAGIIIPHIGLYYLLFEDRR